MVRVAVIAVLSLAGCKAGGDPAPAPPPAPTRTRDAAPPPAGPLDAAYLAIAACDDKQLYLDPCPPEDALGLVDADEPTARAAALRMLTHGSPRVRLAAFMHLRPYATPGDAAAITAAVVDEPDPAIAGAKARVVAWYAADRPELVPLVLRLADDARAEVRRGLFGHGIADLRGVAGVHEALVAHARTDPDRQAQHDACEALGKHGDPRALPVLAELSTRTDDPHLADACAIGMAEMWMDPRNAHEAAFRHTLAFVADGPRVPDQQLGVVIYLGGLADEMRDAPDEWTAKPWVKPAEVEAALVALAKDEAEHPRDRGSAVSALISSGVSRETLRAIRATVPSAPEDESELFYLALQLDEAIGKRP